MKAVCVEAGMSALRRGGTYLGHEDFLEGISAVQAKKKSNLKKSKKKSPKKNLQKIKKNKKNQKK